MKKGSEKVWQAQENANSIIPKEYFKISKTTDPLDKEVIGNVQ